MYNGEPCRIEWSNRMRTAQRKPVMQTRLKNIISGKVFEYSFKFGEKVEDADVSKEKANFLYADADGAHFMNPSTYETIDVSKETLGDLILLLAEGVEVNIVRWSGNPVSVELPPKVELKVTEAPPETKGNSGGNVTKPVTLETGLVVNVPMFIKEGEVIRIRTEDREYVERATESK